MDRVNKHRVDTLTQLQYLELVSVGKILEKNSREEPKVIKLPSGHYLKLFYTKRRFSKWLFLNQAKQFAHNAKKLTAKGVLTVEVQALYHVPHLNCWAVFYYGLEGTSLRQLLKQGDIDKQTIERLVRFIAYLHNAGIYFRSLHPGNILITPKGEIGLVDILDCHFRPHLFSSQRKRNFKHFFRYVEAKHLENIVLTRYAELHKKTNGLTEKITTRFTLFLLGCHYLEIYSLDKSLTAPLSALVANIA